jgi:hypothetical protein
MKHPDEHILSKFAMGCGLTAAQRGSVSRHIAQCHGCRSQVEELGSVYAFAESKLSAPEEVELADSHRSAVLPARESTPTAFNRPVGLTRAIGGALQRAIYFARSRPVTTGVGIIAIGAFAFFGLQWIQRQPSHPAHDPRPSFVRINALHSAIIAYSAASESLWQVPMYWNGDPRLSDEDLREQLCSVSDFYGNGMTQVAVGIRYKLGNEIMTDAIRFFDHRGNLVWTKRFVRPVTFRSEPYHSLYGIDHVLAGPSASERGPREIFFCAKDDRSPCAVIRMTADSLTIGEYWHFGHMSMFPSGVSGDAGTDAVYLCGVNDEGDRVDSSYPAIAVVDPSKITGTTESSVTPGFGFPTSRAERFYARADQPRLPITSTEEAGNAGFVYMKRGHDSSLTFICRSGTPDGRPFFYYTFDGRMKFIRAWTDESSRRFLIDLLGSPLAVDAHIARLEKAVRYWDGRSWQSTWTPILQEGARPPA